MKHISDAVRHFLDLEAEADEEDVNEEEDEDEDILDKFIDNAPTHNLDPRPHASLALRNEDEEIASALDGLLDRVHHHSRSHRTSPTTDANIHFGEYPHSQDYPLSRVACRTGLEETAIMYLHDMADENTRLRSAFMRNSVQGWVYVEGIMDAQLTALLGHTPGIIHTRQGILWQAIPPEDWTRTLTMANPETMIGVNKWIRVQKGIYRGDVGFVVGVESSGVEVLLVPRQVPNSKRKRTPVRPRPILFDPDTSYQLYKADSQELGDGSYTCNGLTFEYGLLRKVYGFRSLVSALKISSHHMALFQLSDHPKIMTSTFPRPQEWIFEEGEQVVVYSHDIKGTVSAIQRDFLEVDLGAEGIRAVLWDNVHKVINIGDFVNVMSGRLCGKAGWVIAVMGDIVSFIEKKVEAIASNDPTCTIESFQIHINWLKVASAPFLHALPSHPSGDIDLLFKRDQVPWIGTSVIVTQLGSPYKGYSGVVKNVLRGQSTSSGLKIEMQLAHLNPHTPFQTITLDYDDVVEIITKKKLLDYSKPSNKIFEDHSKQLLQPSGGETPMPDWNSSTPAWDPSSRTPTLDLSSKTPAWDPSSHTPTSPLHTPTAPPISPVASTSQLTTTPQVAPQHFLLDSRLIGVPLKAIVNGGDYKQKELLISVTEIDGRLSIRYMHYTTSLLIQPDWITLKHPNPTRHNGLLVVIRGEHCGKYVRRIHHRYVEGQALMILAVVKRVNGATDILLGERLELSVDLLCTVSETSEDKKLNSSLMVSLREEARIR